MSGEHDRGTLRARPPERVGRGAHAGTVRLGGGALLHVPPAAASGVQSPLVVLFHGAGSSARAGLDLLIDLADDAGLLLLAPQAHASSWDVIHGGFGPDVERLDHALAHVFRTCPVDLARIALGGFSDGASYVLSLGLGNGDLATHLIAFSPGFVAPVAWRGRPRILVTHGTRDTVLSIEQCSRRLVPRLRSAGYDVTYQEFDVGHVVSAAIARLAVDWLFALAPRRSRA
jgi:phospholipase/carboxylesterase